MTAVSVIWNVLCIPHRLDSSAVQENIGLHAVTCRQSLLQQRGELLGELLPVLFPHLVLETMQDLEKKTKAALRLAEASIRLYPVYSLERSVW